MLRDLSDRGCQIPGFARSQRLMDVNADDVPAGLMRIMQLEVPQLWMF